MSAEQRAGDLGAVRPEASAGQKGILAVGLVAFAALAYVYFPESIDDAYITLRFSRNLFQGNGPVFNAGERVEGYSNFAWMLLLSLLGRAGVPMAAAMKWLSFAAGVGTVVLAWKLAREWFRSLAAVGAATLVLGGSSFLAVWSVDGLETGVYTLLLTGLVFALTRAAPNGWLIGALGALAAVTRPEGVMFALLGVAVLGARAGLRRGVPALALVVLGAGGYQLFRAVYFGGLVSNAALVKLHPGLETAARGWQYLVDFNAASGFLVLPCALLGALAAWRKSALRVVAAFVLAQAFFVLVSGGDFMFGYRFIVPALPFVALLCAAAIEAVAQRGQRVVAVAVVAVLTVGQGVAQFSALPRKHLGVDNLVFRTSTLFEIGRFLAERTRAEDVVVLSEAGIIPFALEAKVVDYLGLVSPYRAVFAGGRRVDTAYVLAGRPKFVVLSFVEGADGVARPRLPMDADLEGCAEFRQDYQASRSFDVPPDGSFLDFIYYRYAPGAKRIFFTAFERR